MPSIKLFVTWVIDGSDKVHVDCSDEYPERVTFGDLRTRDGDKVDFDLRRTHHLDGFCDAHGFQWGIKEIETKAGE